MRTMTLVLTECEARTVLYMLKEAVLHAKSAPSVADIHEATHVIVRIERQLDADKE